MMKTRQGDPRVGDHLTEGLDGDVVFVLYACDIGVARNGGRVGARHGPARFLHFLQTMGTALYNPEHNIDLSTLKVSYYYAVNHDDDLSDDLGKNNQDPLDDAHKRLETAVRTVLESGGLPFVVGGGNDQSFANWSALRQFLIGHQEDKEQTSIGIINIDAHLDVRPVPLKKDEDGVSKSQPNSGTPFRQILEADAATRAMETEQGDDKRTTSTVLWEFAAQGSQCSKEHADYVREMGGTIVWLKDVLRAESATAAFETILDSQKRAAILHSFVSFDLDSIKASDCPGVSCPANIGLTAKDALGIMTAAGKAEHVKLVDMSELNPDVENYITPRLAVQMAYHFLLGYCQRVVSRQKRRESHQHYRLRISNLSQLVCVEDVRGQGFRTREDMAQLNVIENGTVLVDQNGRIAYAGPANCAPDIDPGQVSVEIDGRGKSAIPGLCDAHTHPVWAGDRVHEFALKLAGASYMDLHKIGGGINYTVQQTRQASEETLYNSLVDRLNRLNATGTTLLEAKSGYGLDTDSELKLLNVIDRAEKLLSFVDVVGNFCGAHSIPQGKTEEQALDTVLNEMIPTLAKEQSDGRLESVKLIDVFAEEGVFGTESASKILEAGARIGLLGNFHGDELSYQGCAELTSKVKCRAVSHLEHVSDEGIAAMSESQTAAVLLPTTAFVLRIKPTDARKLIDSGVAVALGTDFNPNAYCSSMPHAMNLACLTMKMTVEEALVASTLNAAYSMGMQESHGSLEMGKHGDLVIIDEPRWEHVIYQFGGAPPLYAVVKDGVPRFLK